MARSLPAPDAFPGSASQPDTEPDSYDYDVPVDSAVAASITPGDVGPRDSSFRVVTPPDAFPGGNQIPPGAADTTGTTGPRRLRRDPSSGTLP